MVSGFERVTTYNPAIDENGKRKKYCPVCGLLRAVEYAKTAPCPACGTLGTQDGPPTFDEHGDPLVVEGAYMGVCVNCDTEALIAFDGEADVCVSAQNCLANSERRAKQRAREEAAAAKAATKEERKVAVEQARKERLALRKIAADERAATAKQRQAERAVQVAARKAERERKKEAAAQNKRAAAEAGKAAQKEVAIWDLFL